MSYKLTREDYEDIKSLIAVTESILDSVMFLSQLEIENKKDTREYQNGLERLKSSLGIEPVIYGRIGDTVLKCMAAIDYIESHFCDFKGDKETLLHGSNTDMVLMRIWFRLSAHIPLVQGIKEIVNEERRGEDPSLDFAFELLEYAGVKSAKSIEMRLAMHHDCHACSLAILKKQIESSQNRDIRSHLITAKYRCSFMYHEIEELLLKENFEIPSNVYMQTLCLGQSQGRQDEEIHFSIQNTMFDMVHNHMRELLFYSDDMLKDPVNKAQAVLLIGRLRASLLLLDESGVEVVNEQFHALVGNDDDREVVGMIVQAFRQHRRDKSIPLMLSFYQKKK